MTTTEKRIQKLEEEVMYIHRDLQALIQIINNLQQPEIHSHYYKIIYNYPPKKEEPTQPPHNFL